MIYQINVQRVRYGRSTVAASTCPDWYAEGWEAYWLVRGPSTTAR
ncbi:MAG TPA: hypothetical protein VIM49_01200 [Dermatophilaceae bacterium]